MNRSNVYLLDLPDEMLIYILSKLDNVDILYSFYGINNNRLERILRDKRYSNRLTFAKNINQTKILRRVCDSILPEIHLNIKCLIVKSSYLERILVACDYPNLSQLKILNFQRDNCIRYFADDSPFGYIFKKQIKKLDIVNEDGGHSVGSWIEYTERLYIHLLSLFEKLEHLNVMKKDHEYPPLTLRFFPSNSFSSASLTYLSIHVAEFGDCLYLLDGRLNQLTTFIVELDSMWVHNNSTIIYNMDDLPNLKCFSLIFYGSIKEFNNEIESLLRRMSNLQKLTLYLRIFYQHKFVNPIDLVNQFSRYSSQLEFFNFYISVENQREDILRYLEKNERKQTFLNIKYEQMFNIYYRSLIPSTCHIYTLPFEFIRLMSIGNIFANMIFNSVIELWVNDEVPFEHEFFLRIAKAFPLLKSFNVSNSASIYSHQRNFVDNTRRDEIIEYPHLISLDLMTTDLNIVDQFLNENKTRLPRLSRFTVRYEDLRITTEDFTTHVAKIA